MATDSFSQHCRQEDATAALAREISMALSRFLIANPSAHLNLALKGDLGAGKTTFARFLIQGMGYVGKVKSPTYTLCEPYSLLIEGSSPVIAHHFDLYRMQSPLEWVEAGFAEHFDAPGFCLIEWPEKAEGTLPLFDLEINLSPGDNEEERDITLYSHSAQGSSLLSLLTSSMS